MDFYSQLESALTNLDYYASLIKPTDEYDDVDYSKINREIEEARRAIRRLQSAHKFYQLSKESFLSILSQSRLTQHVAASYETILSIAKKYSVDVQTILDINNMTSNQLAGGNIISLPIMNADSVKTLQNIPVFGDVTGNLAYGNDVAIDFTEDAKGDLAILSPEETLQQGLGNRVNTKIGGMPLDPSFGHNSFSNSGLPADLTANLVLVDMANNVLQDTRISGINELKVEQITTGKDLKATYSLSATTIINSDVQI